MDFKKWTAYAVLSTLLITPLMTSGTGYAAPEEKAGNKKLKQMQVLQKIENDSKGKQKIAWNEKKGVPNFITGRVSNKKLNTVKDAESILAENANLFDMTSPAQELKLTDQISNDQGKMFKFKQTYKGIPVFGNVLIVHGDKQGNATAINGYFDPEVKSKGLNIKAKLTPAEALQKAKSELGLSTVTQFSVEKSDLFIYQAKDQSYHLTYLVTLSTLAAQEPVYQDVFVDAHSGAIIEQHSRLETVAAVGTGKGVAGTDKTVHYDSTADTDYLRDVTKPMYATGGTIETYQPTNPNTQLNVLITDANRDSIWTDPAAVDAHVNTGIVYDYYHTKFGRNSYDGNGSTLQSVVHYGVDYNNAFWDGTKMVYGDGDGNWFRSFAAAQDVVGHEITHAVTERTAGLLYWGESGALNESWSDVFGNLIENKQDPLWLCGEDIFTPNTDGDAVRSMSSPQVYGQPEHFRDFLPDGDVHQNSGIPNKAFYNFVTAPGVTRDHAAQVWYRALTQYLTPYSNFNDARLATINAAADLYGDNSVEVNAVIAAWNQVGLDGVAPEPVEDSFEPNDSKETAHGPLAPATPYQALIASGEDVDWYKFTTNANTPINVALENLPQDYDIVLYDENLNTLGYLGYGGTSPEILEYTPGTLGQYKTYYVKVLGWAGAFNNSRPYKLTVNYLDQPVNGQWHEEAYSFESAHPYSNHTYTFLPAYQKTGATRVALHINRLELEKYSDFLFVFAGANGGPVDILTGEKQDFWIVVDGDSINAQFMTDATVTSYGVHIDKAAYFTPSAP